jgi:hypothetical protein
VGAAVMLSGQQSDAAIEGIEQARKKLMTELVVELDRSSPVPLYYQAAQRIEQAITNGTLRSGDRLDDESPWLAGSGSPGLRCARQSPN